MLLAFLFLDGYVCCSRTRAVCVWEQVAKMMGGRSYKQCRERYTNYLRDGLNCGPWSKEEDALLLEMHHKIGNKWAEIARHLKGEGMNPGCVVRGVHRA